MDEKINIVVCIKPVKVSLVYPNEDRKTNLCINPYDLYTLQNICKLKKESNLHITCLSMGTKESQEVLRRCLCMGADDVFLISDKVFSGSDTVATSYIISSVIRKYFANSIVLCGANSVDGETGQVAYGIAARLDLPCISQISDMESMNQDGTVIRYNEDGFIKTIQVKGPFVGSFDNFTTKEDVISLLVLKRMKNATIPIYDNGILMLDNDRCGLKGSKTKVTKIEEDTFSKVCEYVEGNSHEQANKILSLVRE